MSIKSLTGRYIYLLTPHLGRLLMHIFQKHHRVNYQRPCSSYMSWSMPPGDPVQQMWRDAQVYSSHSDAGQAPGSSNNDHSYWQVNRNRCCFSWCLLLNAFWNGALVSFQVVVRSMSVIAYV